MKPGILHYESSKGPLEMIDFPGHQRLQGCVTTHTVLFCASWYIYSLGELQSSEAAAQESNEGGVHG